MAKVIRDTAPPQRRVASRVAARALGAESLGVRLSTRHGPISLFALRSHLLNQLHSTGGRPALGRRLQRNKIPFFSDDWKTLKALAKYYKEEEHITSSPGQIAALILHEALTGTPDLSVLAKPRKALRTLKK